MTPNQLSDSVAISVIICTYDRADILTECLSALTNQSLSRASFEIIVVNNYPDVDLSAVVETAYPYGNITTINEPRAGLSIARNTGLNNAKADWVAYIDDDALAKTDWLERALSIINDDQYECFGGMYHPWWKYDRPRWLQESYGSKPRMTETLAEINEGYNWGSNIFFRKKTLQKIGAFPEHLGMKAKGIGYAEETFVQQELRKHNYKIAFDPDLIVYHLVGEHKLKLSWHIQAAYADARDQKHSFPEHYTLGAMLSDLIAIILNPVKALAKWLIRKDFYWENLMIQSLSPLYKLCGKLVAFSK